jgi:hypothetical protein
MTSRDVMPGKRDCLREGLTSTQRTSEASLMNLALTFGETRPIKLSGPDTFKKLHRLILEGNVQNDISPSYRFQVAIFGSTDGKTWFLLNNNRTFATDETMLLGRSQCSCKYFIVVFGGHQEAGAYFNYLTIDSEDRYQDKLR